MKKNVTIESSERLALQQYLRSTKDEVGFITPYLLAETLAPRERDFNYFTEATTVDADGRADPDKMLQAVWYELTKYYSLNPMQGTTLSDFDVMATIAARGHSNETNIDTLHLIATPPEENSVRGYLPNPKRWFGILELYNSVAGVLRGCVAKMQLQGKLEEQHITLLNGKTAKIQGKEIVITDTASGRTLHCEVERFSKSIEEYLGATLERAAQNIGKSVIALLYASPYNVYTRSQPARQSVIHIYKTMAQAAATLFKEAAPEVIKQNDGSDIYLRMSDTVYMQRKQNIIDTTQQMLREFTTTVFQYLGYASSTWRPIRGDNSPMIDTVDPAARIIDERVYSKMFNYHKMEGITPEAKERTELLPHEIKGLEKAFYGTLATKDAPLKAEDERNRRSEISRYKTARAAARKYFATAQPVCRRTKLQVSATQTAGNTACSELAATQKEATVSQVKCLNVLMKKLEMEGRLPQRLL